MATIFDIFLFFSSSFGPSGVRALPLAAGINEGGHYFGPSVDDQAVSLSDDGTTIIIDFFSFFFLSSGFC